MIRPHCHRHGHSANSLPEQPAAPQYTPSLQPHRPRGSILETTVREILVACSLPAITGAEPDPALPWWEGAGCTGVTSGHGLCPSPAQVGSRYKLPPGSPSVLCLSETHLPSGNLGAGGQTGAGEAFPRLDKQFLRSSACVIQERNQSSWAQLLAAPDALRAGGACTPGRAGGHEGPSRSCSVRSGVCRPLTSPAPQLSRGLELEAVTSDRGDAGVHKACGGRPCDRLEAGTAPDPRCPGKLPAVQGCSQPV